MRIARIVLLIALVATLAWNAGELHRRNCMNDGRLGCGVLPWSSGHDRPPGLGQSDLNDIEHQLGITP